MQSSMTEQRNVAALAFERPRVVTVQFLPSPEGVSRLEVPRGGLPLRTSRLGDWCVC